MRMKINAELVRKLRCDKQWSQEQLADACGLNLRTIQRLEKSGKASFESTNALSAVFEVDSSTLVLSAKPLSISPFDAVKICVFKYANFSEKATKPEYWWFLLFVLIVAAIATLLSPKAYQIVGVLVILPLVAVGTRRLKDTGHSGWWQLLLVVPFGQVVVFYLLAQDGRNEAN